MRKFGFSSAAVILAALGLIGFTAKPASAVKEFKDAFAAKYVKADSKDAKDVALAAAFSKASCYTCHMIGTKDKKQRNSYGKELAKLIKKTDKADTEKINKALEDVAKIKSASGKTFGEKIADGKLPASTK